MQNYNTEDKTEYLLDKAFSSSYEVESFRNDIRHDGYCLPIGPRYRVYNGALAALLIAEGLSVTIDTRKVQVTHETIDITGTTVTCAPIVTETGEIKAVSVDGKDFAESYRAGYREGQAWFRENYPPKPELLYGTRAESYIEALQTFCYHMPCGPYPPGLMGWKGIMVNPATHAHVWHLGYYSGMIAEVEILAVKYPNLLSDPEQAPAAPAAPAASGEPKSKKPAARPFANFTDKLQNGFTEEDLAGLLIRVNFKNSDGETLRFTKYLMHQVIEELVKAEYFERGNCEDDQKALSRYLGIPETRVAVEHGRPKKSVREKVKAYLLELENQRKING